MTDTELPVVSVVVPTHGRPELVRRAVDSVTAQDYAGVVETIVVHDGEEVDPSLASDDPRRPVRVIVNDHRRGLPGARNAGLDRIRGDLVASLDDDDWWEPRKLTVQVRASQEHPEVKLIASGVFLYTGEGRVTERILDTTVITHRDFLIGRVLEVHSSNLLVDPRIFALAGRYTEGMHIEDYDFLLRAARHSDVYVVPEALAHIYRTEIANVQRWPVILEAREQLGAAHPELLAARGPAGVFYGKTALAHAACGHRWQAVRWAVKGLRKKPVNLFASVALVVGITGIPVRWVQTAAGKFGKSF